MKVPEEYRSKLAELNLAPTPFLLVVNVSDQKLRVFKDGEMKCCHDVSTAEKGTGQVENSLQTPLGLLRVAEKIGAGEPPFTIFKARKSTGQVWEPESDRDFQDDLILSRILWLEGLEEGFNKGRNRQGLRVDTYKRYVYIHGTNHESEIGKPASHGCIRMRNADIVELYNLVPVGSHVWVAS